MNIKSSERAEADKILLDELHEELMEAMRLAGCNRIRVAATALRKDFVGVEDFAPAALRDKETIALAKRFEVKIDGTAISLTYEDGALVNVAPDGSADPRRPLQMDDQGLDQCEAARIGQSLNAAHGGNAAENAGILRSAGPGRNQDPVSSGRKCLRRADLVAPNHFNARAQFLSDLEATLAQMPDDAARARLRHGSRNQRKPISTATPTAQSTPVRLSGTPCCFQVSTENE